MPYFAISGHKAKSMNGLQEAAWPHCPIVPIRRKQYQR
jgi:hypothetical protein